MTCGLLPWPLVTMYLHFCSVEAHSVGQLRRYDIPLHRKTPSCHRRAFDYYRSYANGRTQRLWTSKSSMLDMRSSTHHVGAASAPWPVEWAFFLVSGTADLLVSQTFPIASYRVSLDFPFLPFCIFSPLVVSLAIDTESQPTYIRPIRSKLFTHNNGCLATERPQQ